MKKLNTLFLFLFVMVRLCLYVNIGACQNISLTKGTSITSRSSTTAEPDFRMIGFATVAGDEYNTTSGGAGGNAITISTLAELQSWADSREKNTTPEIVYISGSIAAEESTVVTVKHGANVSVLGLGSTAELVNVGLNFRNYKNVVVRNLKIHEVFYPNDGLTIDECQHVWVDHCEFYSKIGAGIGVDTYDGLLDIKKGSRYVTISWNHFHDHMKTVLIGHTDNAGAEAQDSQIRVTFHHNFFENTNGRNPSLRWGAVHMYNNYLKNISDYGIAIRQGAHALLENNVYENVRLPISTNKFRGQGYACERGNTFTGNSGNNSITQTACDWWNDTTLPYAYSLDPVNTVTTMVPAYVGVGKVDVKNPEEENPAPEEYQVALEVSGEGTVSPLGGTFAKGEQITFTASPSEGWQFVSWSGDASGRENPFTLTLDEDISITALFSEVEGEITSLPGEKSKGPGFTFYPNPSTGATTFEFNLTGRERVRISLFTVDGLKVQEVLQKTFEAGSHKVSVRPPALKAGIYFYVAEIGKESWRKKLVVE